MKKLHTSYTIIYRTDGEVVMSDDRHRATVRMPPEAYQRLCDELPSFSTDTARFQYLMQFYFDLIDMGFLQCLPSGPNAPAHGQPHQSLNEDTESESESENPIEN